jgi:hypothetical protein
VCKALFEKNVGEGSFSKAAVCVPSPVPAEKKRVPGSPPALEILAGFFRNGGAPPRLLDVLRGGGAQRSGCAQLAGGSMAVQRTTFLPVKITRAAQQKIAFAAALIIF